ncbi:MAG: calcium-binding protein [Cyanobacteria bacterium J06649_12]
MSIFERNIFVNPVDELDIVKPLLADIVANPLDGQNISALLSTDTSDETPFRLSLAESSSDLLIQQNNLSLGKVPTRGGGALPFDPGNGGKQLILGTSDDDVISGSSDDEEIHGYGGEDDLFGGDGNDTIYGGDDNDHIDGGSGDDNLSGGDGDDVINGSYGDDVMNGGDGDDEMHGSSGDDTIYGGAGDDEMYGGDGDDEMYGGAGDDVMHSHGDGEVYGGDGDDEIYGSGMLYGGEGDDYLEEVDGNNSTLHGGDGDDILIGYAAGSGDVLVGGSGADRYHGRGGGNDTYESIADGAQDTFVVDTYNYDNSTVAIHGFELMSDPADTNHDIIELDLDGDFYTISHFHLAALNQTDTLILSSSTNDVLAVVVDVEIPIVADNPYITMV